MRLFLTFILLIVLFHNPLLAAEEECEGEDACIIILKQNKKANLVAQNKTDFILTMKVDLKSVNIEADQEFPMMFVLNPNERLRITNLEHKVNTKAAEFQVLYNSIPGDYRIKSSRYSYKFPYKIGTSFIVGQGFNDEERTHHGINKYAIDWNMPIGTPIYPARAGIVVDIKNDSNISGNDPKLVGKANYVKILHKDGSTATYAHLKKGGVEVKKGDKVGLNKIIGYSGNTGYTSGPHLHFHISKPISEGETLTEETLPFKMKNCESPTPFIPQTGHTYKSC